MDWELLKATKNDYEFCYELTKRNMYELFCRHWGGWVDSEFRKGFIPEDTMIIMSSNEPVGYLSCKKSDDGVYIDNIQIVPEHQGNGIGTKVLTDLLDRHRNESIRLTTFEDNPARHLYEKLGFCVYEKDGFTIRMEKRPNKTSQRTQTTGTSEI